MGKVNFIWRGNHHFYIGAFFTAFGLFQWYMGIGNGSLTTLIPLWQVIAGIGALMMVDDVIEHNITDKTPLRMLWNIIEPILEKMKNDK